MQKPLVYDAVLFALPTNAVHWFYDDSARFIAIQPDTLIQIYKQYLISLESDIIKVYRTYSIFKIVHLRHIVNLLT